MSFRPGCTRDGEFSIRMEGAVTSRWLNDDRSIPSVAKQTDGRIKLADIHEGLDSALTLLGQQLGGGVEIVRDYVVSEHIDCAPGDSPRIIGCYF